MCCMTLESRTVPWAWKDAMLVSLYKGKGDKEECKNYRKICQLCVDGKVYDRIFIDRVLKITDGMIGGKQRGRESWLKIV